ncbi:hypothetical protein [Bradyrhizobium sp. NBAIM14]|uniref:hypothetical protein n=1 Tax=Bradyrhizobium sp. NBAIM14 TaxID=2793814 RepID=UPI001CD4CF91|nr:hypothetical protein [Bradyrhizobium sp. NBAIM14]MCA1498851.1 hypothetical protein [Bradyrhizobium sp. NBAIM14]
MQDRSGIRKGAFIQGGYCPGHHVTTLSLDADPQATERLAELAAERDALGERLAEIRRKVTVLRGAK